MDLEKIFNLKKVSNLFDKVVFLENLIFKDCTNLKNIHAIFDGMINMKRLWFEECKNMEDMPIGLKHKLSLQALVFRGFIKIKIEDDTYLTLMSL